MQHARIHAVDRRVSSANHELQHEAQGDILSPASCARSSLGPSDDFLDEWDLFSSLPATRSTAPDTMCPKPFGEKESLDGTERLRGGALECVCCGCRDDPPESALEPAGNTQEQRYSREKQPDWRTRKATTATQPSRPDSPNVPARVAQVSPERVMQWTQGEHMPPSGSERRRFNSMPFPSRSPLGSMGSSASITPTASNRKRSTTYPPIPSESGNPHVTVEGRGPMIV
ncbi:hypothetical protein OPQ81_002778 [Rhizoctonia solani]|nr:hypothetical protein OPQ81_002778 [Rhizoctonia solani]